MFHSKCINYVLNETFLVPFMLSPLLYQNNIKSLITYYKCLIKYHVIFHLFFFKQYINFILNLYYIIDIDVYVPDTEKIKNIFYLSIKIIWHKQKHLYSYDHWNKNTYILTCEIKSIFHPFKIILLFFFNLLTLLTNILIYSSQVSMMKLNKNHIFFCF